MERNGNCSLWREICRSSGGKGSVLTFLDRQDLRQMRLVGLSKR